MVAFSVFIRYELRLRFFPKNFKEFLDNEKVTFYYLYDQVYMCLCCVCVRVCVCERERAREGGLFLHVGICIHLP